MWATRLNKITLSGKEIKEFYEVLVAGKNSLVAITSLAIELQ